MAEPMPYHLRPTYPYQPGHATVGRPAHRYSTGMAYIPYRIGMVHVPDPLPLAVPQVLSTTFSLQFPTYGGAPIGRCLARNNPDSWAIASGNDDLHWAIDNSGILTVFNIGGMFEGVHYEITVTAANEVGTSEPTEIFITTSGAKKPSG